MYVATVLSLQKPAAELTEETPGPSFARVQTWLSIIALIAMQAIMVHRIVCMYSYNRKVILGLLIGYGPIFITGVVIGVLTMRVNSIPIIISPSIRVCFPEGIPSFNVANWFLMMAFDLSIFALAVSEAIRYIKESRNLRNTGIFAGTRFERQGTLIRILLRDSIVFPLIGLLICVFNILANYVLVMAVGYMLVITSVASPILGCRLILHLRDAYYQPFKSEFDGADRVDVPIEEMPSFALQSTTHSSNRRSSRTSAEAVP
ncbi:hypothetical protein EST38_g1935 [Candolleomyces aberdarensis]|uniref:Uncharacterized protein n=1 Tax=Candolleomyces aberdarensis TaxID=2316362 RepID=A0A4Q2DTS2_9AGAR|nr:hypothetical protein EST38_g1935 [Candolleomyces aberdarensis]